MERNFFFKAVMHFQVRFAVAGQRPKDKPAQGNALGSGLKFIQSPERAAHLVAPLQGFVGCHTVTQGVALGWLVCAPLVLPSLTGQSS